jgi:hypothetical protein
MLMAMLAAIVLLGLSQPAAAGGWDDDDDYGYRRVYYPPAYVNVYYVYAPAPRYVHVYSYAGYGGYYGGPTNNPYYAGAWGPAPYYRSYYPVRDVRFVTYRGPRRAHARRW